MKIIIFVLTVLVAFATAKPIKRTSEATVDVDYKYNYDRDTHYNLEYDEYGINRGPIIYDVDKDFDVYEVEYVLPQYEIVKETDIEIDYALEAEKKNSSKTKIRTK